MPAFATRSGLPNSTINLATGASAAMPWANGGAVLSELGSVQLELARPPFVQHRVRVQGSAAMPCANGGAVLSELGSVQLELTRPPHFQFRVMI